MSGAAGMDVDGGGGVGGGGSGGGRGPQGGQAGGEGRGRRKRGRASEGFKERVLGVLRSGGFEEQRSAKLAQDDFLRLLAAFNRTGIHFA